MRVRPAQAVGGTLDGCSVHGLGTAAITLHRIYGTRLTVEIGRHQTNVVFSVAAWHSAGPRFADWAPGAASIGCGVLWCGRMRRCRESVQGPATVVLSRLSPAEGRPLNAAAAASIHRCTSYPLVASKNLKFRKFSKTDLGKRRQITPSCGPR